MPITDPDYIAALEAAEGGPVYSILLATLDHLDFAFPLRFTSDNQTTVSRANPYTPRQFLGATLSKQGVTVEDQATAAVQVNDADALIVNALRVLDPLRGQARVSFEVVGSHAPDVVQLGPFEFLLAKYQEQGPILTLNLVAEPLHTEPLPKQSFVPSAFPNLFGGVVGASEES